MTSTIVDIKCDKCYEELWSTDGIELIDKDIAREINDAIKSHECQEEEEELHD